MSYYLILTCFLIHAPVIDPVLSLMLSPLIKKLTTTKFEQSLEMVKDREAGHAAVHGATVRHAVKTNTYRCESFFTHLYTL